MLEKSRLMAVAELIRDQITISSLDQYCAQTGICGEDFVALKPCDFDGETFAIDGSNVVICDWTVARVNKISAGYVVYRGPDWQRTVITYDDVFLSDARGYERQFRPFLEVVFGVDEFSLKDSELDRLSTYFRELQEYVALYDAVMQADPGDLVLYDGGFTWKERPLGQALSKVFEEAENRCVDLLGISKSSAISWGFGEGVSRPFVVHTCYAGNIFLPNTPWYVSITGKNVEPRPKWDGETFIVNFDATSGRAFRVDVPSYMEDRAALALRKLVPCSCSAECLGYPHALFRAHRDIRITDEEGVFLRLRLIDMLSEMGIGESAVSMLMLDFHDVIEMRRRI